MALLDRTDDPRVVGDLAPRRQSRVWFVAVRLTAVTVLAVCAIAAIAWCSGWRWFVVQTPSMAEAAPVGTLVVIAPLTAAPAVGDVIAFHPPGVPRVYTHRVVEVLASGAVHTRGDLNGADDAWTTPASAVIGRAVALVPAGGYVARGLPILIAGGLLLWWATARIRRDDRRAAARIGGMHLLLSFVLLFLHPLVSMTVLATQTDGAHLHASVVSTGLLPIAVRAPDGDVLAHLHDGQAATVPLEVSAATGRLALDAVLSLPPVAHILLIALTLLPAGVLMIVGLPRQPEPVRRRSA